MEKIRKFVFEAGLNVYPSFKALISVEQLSEFGKKDNHQYHIYAILTRDQLYFKSEKTYIDDEGLHATVFAILDNKEKEYELPPLKIAEGLKEGMAEIKIVHPNEIAEISIIDKDFLTNKPEIRNTQIIISANDLFDIVAERIVDKIEYEVLYIGQAFGKDGGRTALDRLSAHSTLQKILSEAKLNFPTKHIYIMLWEMASNLGMSFDGITKTFKCGIAEDNAHMKSVLSDLPQGKQVVNVTEAAMIYYFKPVYNEKLVENFPNKNLKSYRQYFDLDYNSITVELDLDFDNFPQVQLYTDTNSIRSEWQPIRYPLHNEKDRRSMYDLFVNE